ncbi:CHAT domain-containing protein [Burkholderia sp. D7]|nr:CHAT domain-containing protein [Burkholderia sp. D7]
MRVTLLVQSAPGSVWQINAQGRGIAWQRRMIQMDDGDGGLLPFPDPATLAAEEPLPGGLADLAAAQVRRVYMEIVDRNPQHIVEYGRYLFDNLLGTVHWQQILAVAEELEEPLVEIALLWAADESNLARLHWEMMSDGTNFLAAGLRRNDTNVDVAFTRVVKGSSSTAKSLSSVPRVLFAVGTSSSDHSIRPGAEIMGLLRDAESGCPIHPLVIENASPALLQKRIQAFRPEVVHFICHGDLDLATKQGFIELKPDPHNNQSKFFAAQIWQWLNVANSPPQIVVLSSCKTGTAVGSAIGPEAVAPLAAELVHVGVPVVIAMSGRISDLACRLFTRRFGRALVSAGETLVAATTKGRRAAIAEGDAPRRSVDWGFPAVYLSENVEPGYRPSVAAAARIPSPMSSRLLPYELRRLRTPVFCGRTEFFHLFDELFTDPERGVVLAAFAKDTKKAYGRTRLLEELVIQAVRHQHVPCAVLASQESWRAPLTVMDLAMLIHDATETARQSLGLPTGNEGPIVQLRYFDQKQATLPDLDARLAKALRVGWTSPGDIQVSSRAVSEAIEMQFAEMMKEAREKNLVNDTGRAVLLLDDVHKYSVQFDSIATCRRFGAFGFGSPQEPVPVVMSFSLDTPASDLLRPIAESQRPLWRALPLGPFARDQGHAEDMFAYARVLLNPFDKEIAKGVSDAAWVMDYNIDGGLVSKWEEKFRRWLDGVPGEFLDKRFFLLAEDATSDAFLKPATDWDEMNKALREIESMR